jgi:MbtH protein
MNPFDDQNGRFTALVNDEGQHCVWPSFAEVPPGWTVRLADSSRADCLAHVEANWVDIRPNSLIAAMRAG